MAIRTRGLSKFIKRVKLSVDEQSGFAWFDSSTAPATLFDSSILLTPSAGGPASNTRAVNSTNGKRTFQSDVTDSSKTASATGTGVVTNSGVSFESNARDVTSTGASAQSLTKLVSYTRVVNSTNGRRAFQSDVTNSSKTASATGTNASTQSAASFESNARDVTSNSASSQNLTKLVSYTRDVSSTNGRRVVQSNVTNSSKTASVTGTSVGVQNVSNLVNTVREVTQLGSSTQSAESTVTGIVEATQTALAVQTVDSARNVSSSGNQTTGALQGSVTFTAKVSEVVQSLVVTSSVSNNAEVPPGVEETGIKGVGGRKTRKLQKVVHKHLSYEQRKQLDDKIYDLVLEEVLGIVPAKTKAVEITKEIVKDIPKTDKMQASGLDKAFLQETARLQAWLIVEELKRKAEEDDEQALLALI